MLLSSTPQPVIRKDSFQQILNIHSPMKRNHSLLECTRDNDTQVSELRPSGPSCYLLPAKDLETWYSALGTLALPGLFK